jgi:hypothetical protein
MKPKRLDLQMPTRESLETISDTDRLITLKSVHAYEKLKEGDL